MIPRSALTGRASVVAPDLLGCLLRIPADGTLVRIIEVEAYEQHDPAAHSFRGRTDANAVMFGPAGHLYTYFVYGMHWCANVVTGAEGDGQALLLRAGELVEGEEVVRSRRGVSASGRDLLRGPARLAQALGFGRSQGGLDLLAPDAPVQLLAREGPPPPVTTGPRVGVRLAPDLPWRFWITDHPLVSPYRRHPQAG